MAPPPPPRPERRTTLYDVLRVLQELLPPGNDEAIVLLVQRLLEAGVLRQPKPARKDPA
jgi:hypothetical protein